MLIQENDAKYFKLDINHLYLLFLTVNFLPSRILANTLLCIIG